MQIHKPRIEISSSVSSRIQVRPERPTFSTPRRSCSTYSSDGGISFGVCKISSRKFSLLEFRWSRVHGATRMSDFTWKQRKKGHQLVFHATVWNQRWNSINPHFEWHEVLDSWRWGGCFLLRWFACFRKVAGKHFRLFGLLSFFLLFRFAFLTFLLTFFFSFLFFLASFLFVFQSAKTWRKGSDESSVRRSTDTAKSYGNFELVRQVKFQDGRDKITEATAV